MRCHLEPTRQQPGRCPCVPPGLASGGLLCNRSEPIEGKVNSPARQATRGAAIGNAMRFFAARGNERHISGVLLRIYRDAKRRAGVAVLASCADRGQEVWRLEIL